MSASNEWTIWHLTPRGWERGDEKTDFGQVDAKPTPSGTVLTVKYREFMSSMFSSMEKTCDEIWRDTNESLVSELLATFGPAPRRL